MSQTLINELKEENLSTYFVLPLLQLNKFSFINPNYVNSYLTEDRKYIVVEVVLQSLLSRTVYYSHPCFRGLCRSKNNEHLYLVYEIPNRWTQNVLLFTLGKFSEFSNGAKEKIIRFSTLLYQQKENGYIVTDGRLLALEKHVLMKEMWEERLSTNGTGRVELNGEVLSIPGKESYIKLEDLIQENPLP